MEVVKYIGNWGNCNIGKGSLHIDDIHLDEGYPFKGQIHKCIRVEDNFLVIKFSCIELRLIPSEFHVIETPCFFPFDVVSYLSSKGNFEIGVISSYRMLFQPEPILTYLLNINGKTKSTFYHKERLQLVASSRSINTIELSEIVSQILSQELDSYGINSVNGWFSVHKLLCLIRVLRIDWQNLQYFDILRMVDNSNGISYEIKSERISPEYKNNFLWYIRLKFN